jgi:hypothetical protein
MLSTASSTLENDVVVSMWSMCLGTTSSADNFGPLDTLVACALAACLCGLQGWKWMVKRSRNKKEISKTAV